MISFKSKQTVERDFMPKIKIQGQVYFLVWSLLPHRPDDLQIYFIADPDNAHAEPGWVASIQYNYFSTNFFRL
jgi:hypothetical protein